MAQRLTLLQRITQEHKRLYQERALTTKELAQLYGTTLNYIYQLLPRPPLPPNPPKSVLIQARRLHRKLVATTLPPREAAELTHYSIRTIARDKQEARKNGTT